MNRHFTVAIPMVAVLIFQAPAAFAGEGFGFSKRAVNLERRVPPQVLLIGNGVEVVVADDRGHATVARKVRDGVEEKMTSYDSRYSADGGGQPAYRVELEIQDAAVDESWTQKTEYESRKTGTKVEYDSKGNKKEKPVYTSVPIQVNYKTVSGKVNARYRVIDVASRQEIHKGSSTASWDRTYKKGEGAPTRSGLEGTLAGNVAAEIAGQVAGRTEQISVLVPRGSFDRLVAVAERGDWTTYGESISAMAPKKKPADEAYRQYAMGVAAEGLASRASDDAEALALLRKAGEHYRKASSLKPNEELFAKAYSNEWSGGRAASPIERVESGIQNLETLIEQKAKLAAAKR
jgi:hypothetical protein